jgi:fructoselysine-6-P-deglycase FrlB-like protein
MSLPAPHETLMYREAAEAADVIAAQFARNEATVQTLAATLRAGQLGPCRHLCQVPAGNPARAGDRVGVAVGGLGL